MSGNPLESMRVPPEEIAKPKTLHGVFGIVKEWMEYNMSFDGIGNFSWLNYDNVELLAQKFLVEGIEKKQIEQFCMQITNADFGSQVQAGPTPNAPSKITGYTLSAFINLYGDPKDTVELNIAHLRNFEHLSYLRQGNVIVRGVYEIVQLGTDRKVERITSNLGDCIGSYHQGGTLEIYGNYYGDDFAFFVRGGKVILYGNASDMVFRCMQNGEGIIVGDVGGNVGIGMEQGKIEIYGNVGTNKGRESNIGTIGYDKTGGEIIVHGVIN